MPPRSLPAFLQAARAALTAPGQRPLTFVVGNESADLDSLCSAVVLAYLRSHTPPHTLHIPLCHLPRVDLDLRPELAVALGEEEEEDAPTTADLITLSELPDRLDAQDTRWLLVDHNALTGDLARRFASRVVGCIDHHADEGAVPTAVQGEEPRIIERAGSCASLVVEACRGAWRDLAQRQPDAAADRVLARLALSPIVVDTANLTSTSKTEDVDRRAVAFLGEMAYDDNVDRRTAALYERLMHRKNDIAAWTYDMLLRKDYKQWTEGTQTLGMASVVQGLDFLLARNGPRAVLRAAVQAFAAQRGLDLLALMTVQFDAGTGTGTGTMARQLVVWAFNRDAARVAQAFADANRDRLGLAPWTDTEGQPLFGADVDDDDDDEEAVWHRCWTQTRTECSRKQVAPWLREAMRSGQQNEK